MIKNWDKFFENENNLPESVDIDAELEQLRELNKEKEKMTKKSDYKDIIDKIKSKEYKEIINKQDNIEEKIKEKLFPIMMKYCDEADFEGAKWFVGRSYKDLNTVGKTLLFRTILLREKEVVGKYNI